MAVLVLCRGASAALRHVEPVIVLEQLGNTLFETALQMVVKDRSANASSEADQQKAMTDFYLTYNLIIRFVPIGPSLLLAWLSDRGWRRAPVVVPLSGYLLSRLLLLLVVVGGFPLGVMFAAAALFGLTGGYSAFWPGVMTLVSLRSSAAERSKVTFVYSSLKVTSFSKHGRPVLNFFFPSEKRLRLRPPLGLILWSDLCAITLTV